MAGYRLERAEITPAAITLTNAAIRWNHVDAARAIAASALLTASKKRGLGV
jgi:hypothetical protein